MKEFDELVSAIKRLRSKKGCPWDRGQTHKTLKPYIVEEAYELLSAIDGKDSRKIKDELGDVLLQVILHSQIGSESKKFNIKDVIKSISEKMKRRHPHVFSGKKASGVDDVWKKWEEIKRGEGNARSILDSVPKAMPALYRADKVQKKAARVGFDWDNVAGAWDKIFEEIKEIEGILGKKNGKNKIKELSEEIGDLIFSVVNVSRKLGINAEEALQGATAKFSKRFLFIEKYAKKHKKKLDEMSLTQMDRLWRAAKGSLKKRSQLRV